MLQDVYNLKLLPPTRGKVDISRQIERLFSGTTAIRAAIAFWTLSKDKLNQMTAFNALKVLTKPDSFLCVDINYPTNIDHLADLVRSGVAVYLSIRRLPRELSKITMTNSPGLLHTKILLADKEDNNAEVEHHDKVNLLEP